MDNESSESDKQIQLQQNQTKKPLNRNTFAFKKIIMSSQFPAGNLKTATFMQQYRNQADKVLNVQFWGNSDAQTDPIDKSWFYFTITPIQCSYTHKRQINYKEIIFKFKNANVYRKFTKQRKYKPYIVYKEQYQNCTSNAKSDKTWENYSQTQRQRRLTNNQGSWQALYLSQINILQNQIIQAQFIYVVKPEVKKVHFAQNLPYTLQNLDKLHLNINKYQQINTNVNTNMPNQVNKDTKIINRIYYHRQAIALSVDQYPIYMCTITSVSNILSFQQNQPQIWDSKGENQNNRNNDLNMDKKSQRPYLLKNRPEIVFTSRVHPSQISSSYCVQGIIESLIKNPDFQFLTNLFIFRIVPMVNPDGVQNGHYRLDNYLQNLNRFYGHSDPIKTPPIYAIQKMVTLLRQKSKLFLFMDIHGHNSPKPSFIFGNYCQNFFQTLQNKTFVKIIDLLSEGNFDALCCQFSKRHMTIKQKYDQHSKEASARVFAYRGSSVQQNNTNSNGNANNINTNLNNINSNINNQAKVVPQKQSKKCLFVQHSYTLQLHPYIIGQSNIRRSVTKKQTKESSSYKNLPKSTNMNNINPSPNVNSTNTINNPMVNSNGRRTQPSTYTQIQPSQSQIVEQYKKIGENVLYSIQEMLGINVNLNYVDSISASTNSSLSNNISSSTNINYAGSKGIYQRQSNQDGGIMRKRVFKEISKMVEYYQRCKKSKCKEINRELFERYYQKLNVLQLYRQFISNTNTGVNAMSHNKTNVLTLGLNPIILAQLKNKLKECPVHYIYEQWIIKKDKLEQLNAKRIKYMKQRNQEPLNRNRSQNNSNNNNSSFGNQEFKPKFKEIYWQKQRIQDEQQQDNGKYETIIYSSKINTRQIQQQTLPAQKVQLTAKNTKVLKSIQFDMTHNAENKVLHQQVVSNNYNYGHGSAVKNSNNMVVTQKKSSIVNSHISDIQNLQRKIRKLMFRHRTQNQICEDSDEQESRNINTQFNINMKAQSNNINGLPLGITYVPEGKQYVENQISSFKYAKRVNKDRQKQKYKQADKEKQKQKWDSKQNKLEPLTKNKKTKIVHLKTQQSRRSSNANNYNYYFNYNQPLQFNDKLIIDKPERRSEALQGLQPRIQEFVKKISLQKYDQTIANQKNTKIVQREMQKQKQKQKQKQTNLLQVKASNMSNASISRRKKSVTRVSHSRQKQKEKLIIIKSDEPSKQRFSNMIGSSNYNTTTNANPSNHTILNNIYESYLCQANLNEQQILNTLQNSTNNITNNVINSIISAQQKQNSSAFRQKLNGLYNNSNNVFGTIKSKSKNSEAHGSNVGSINKNLGDASGNGNINGGNSVRNEWNNEMIQDNSIMRSVRVLTIEQVNKTQLIQKSKKLLMDRKRQDRQEQSILPMIGYNSNVSHRN